MTNVSADPSASVARAEAGTVTAARCGHPTRNALVISWNGQLNRFLPLCREDHPRPVDLITQIGSGRMSCPGRAQTNGSTGRSGGAASLFVLVSRSGPQIADAVDLEIGAWWPSASARATRVFRVATVNVHHRPSDMPVMSV